MNAAMFVNWLPDCSPIRDFMMKAECIQNNLDMGTNLMIGACIFWGVAGLTVYLLHRKYKIHSDAPKETGKQ